MISSMTSPRGETSRMPPSTTLPKVPAAVAIPSTGSHTIGMAVEASTPLAKSASLLKPSWLME